MNKPPVLYTTKEAMGMLKVSRTTLYRIVKNGDLKPIKVGSGIRFTEDEINRYLDELKGK
mgnify:CR=1 FL=1